MVFGPLTVELYDPNAGRTDTAQLELIGQFRLIGDRAWDVSGGRICLTQNAHAEI